MRSFIGIHKGTGLSGLAAPVSNYRGSLAWALAGYKDWPSGGSSPPGDWNHCAPTCPLVYKDMIVGAGVVHDVTRVGLSKRRV